MEGYGEKIKKLRKEKGWSQEYLAIKIGEKDRWNISRFETETSVPDLLAIKEMCKVFHVSADHLVCGMKEQNHKTHDICKTTGLSEKAVEILTKLNNFSDEDPEAEKLLNTISILIQYSIPENSIGNYTKRGWPDNDKPINEIAETYNPNPEENITVIPFTDTQLKELNSPELIPMDTNSLFSHIADYIGDGSSITIEGDPDDPVIRNYKLNGNDNILIRRDNGLLVDVRKDEEEEKKNKQRNNKQRNNKQRKRKVKDLYRTELLINIGNRLDDIAKIINK